MGEGERVGGECEGRTNCILIAIKAKKKTSTLLLRCIHAFIGNIAQVHVGM